jgi:hypothetical protein
MPNWCVGTLKVRGSKENIINFLKNGFTPVTWMGTDIPMKVVEEEYSFTISCDDKFHGFHVKGTHRNFIESKEIEFEHWDEDNETHVLILEDYKAAWGIEAEPLAELSKEYQLDFRLYAFERGMEFNQEIEIHKGKIIKDVEIKFDDYAWECINPSLGG